MDIDMGINEFNKSSPTSKIKLNGLTEYKNVYLDESKNEIKNENPNELIAIMKQNPDFGKLPASIQKQFVDQIKGRTNSKDQDVSTDENESSNEPSGKVERDLLNV